MVDDEVPDLLASLKALIFAGGSVPAHLWVTLHKCTFSQKG